MGRKGENKRKNVRRNNLLQLVAWIIIIILANVIVSYIPRKSYTRLDLTSDKRHSLSDATKALLEKVDDIVYFQVYLDGDFPSGFKRLRSATVDMLDEFRAYNKNIQYEFINPSSSDDAKERSDTYQLLIQKGLQPTDLQVNTKQGKEQQVIFPGAIASYKGRELPVDLLNTQMGVPPEEVLNNSVESLEFRLASVIRNLTISQKPKIAFLGGQGELGDKYIQDAAQALSKQYSVERVIINGQLSSLAKRDSIGPDKARIINKFDALIIAKPDSAFSEMDKFIIDQFIMKGGKVLWLIDKVNASMDSLQNTGTTLGIDMDLNLEDMLFEYGVRINSDLVLDLNALRIPLKTGQIGNQPQIDFYPWYYFPLLTPSSDNPIVKNLNAIKTEFVSSLDTTRLRGVKKTILLRTSRYSRVANTPVLISLNILNQKPDPREFPGPPQNVGVLLEGKFRSLYENRIPPVLANNGEIGFDEVSRPTKMIVVSDGDIIKNQLHYSKGYALPLGYDQYTDETYGNKDFILNAMDYLTDASGLISIRSRDLKLRLLDMTRVNNNKIFWQVLNTILPVLLVIIFGIIQFYIRKRKYSSTHR